MRKFATVSSELVPSEVEAIVLDYCPDCLRKNDPLNPVNRMWDADEESRRMVELTMPAIRENYVKFDRFYHERCNLSKGSYTSSNFDNSLSL